MKARFLVIPAVTLLLSSVGSSLMAFETMVAEEGRERALPMMKISAGQTENQKDAKIAYLTKLLEQQQKLYENKISYLEFELKKSKERLVEKSINHEKTQDFLETKFAEESAYLKRELVAKTKTMLEYQRQLEKIKPSEDFKNLIKVNTELAIEVRKSADQLALIQLKHEEEKGSAAKGRMPASVEK